MPKSRGRRTSSGGKKQRKPVRRSPMPLQLADQVIRDARQHLDSSGEVLIAEAWASGWLGQAWLDAPLAEREAEHHLCMQVVGRASTTPSPAGLAAVAALQRVAPVDSKPMLAGTVAILTETQPLPSWHKASGHHPVRAWQAVDVWDSKRVLFIAYDEPTAHTLMAQITQTAGTMVEKLGLLTPSAAAAWSAIREEDDVPMPLADHDVPAALADLAAALRMTDMTWPRNDDEDFVALRALAWARCRHHLPDWPEHTSLSDLERDCLLDAFTATHADEPQTAEVIRSLAELFLGYGEDYIATGPLSWSPGQAAVFLVDWLPRKAVLDREQRTLLPDTLKRWVHFALTERGVEPRWIAPVTDAIEAHLPDFYTAFDDQTTWGPAKQIAALLTERGIDPTDHDAVNSAMRTLNAERLAHQLTQPPPRHDS
ncbi:hypothetical protein ABIA33_006444 [Streptacidiphilus sp. MAP12-16]|uniref:hypothetical protein n=1 Tax=Streptacidiphilus sp. MAP12-16 TaxID=3156300 RepID=UPI003517A5B3